MSVIYKCKGHTFTILILWSFVINYYKFCVSLSYFITIENFFYEQAFSKEIFIALETKSIWKSYAIWCKVNVLRIIHLNVQYGGVIALGFFFKLTCILVILM